MNKKCPLCGQLLNGNKIQPKWRKKEQTNYAFDEITTIAPNATWTHRKPARSATLESNVYVPLLQALASAALTAILVGSLASLTDWAPWPAALLTAGITGFLAWTLLTLDHQKLLWEIEEITGVDLDNDGQTGKPSKQLTLIPTKTNIKATVRLEDQEGRLKAMRFATLPETTSNKDMVAIARLLTVEGKSLSRRNLKEIVKGDNYSTLIYSLLRSRLIAYRNGKNDANGYDLTRPGKALMKRWMVVGGGGGSTTTTNQPARPR